MTRPQKLLTEVFPAATIQSETLSGGDINTVFKVLVNQEICCIKVNRSDEFPGMFDAEKYGLELISKTKTFRVPKVIDLKHSNEYAFLVMEFVETGELTEQSDQLFAKNLAKLHRVSSGSFGLERSNYIGSLEQRNELRDTWPDFYTEMRILPMMISAVDKEFLSPSDVKAIERMCQKLNELFPAEPPALVHGDLWNGNYMIDRNGDPVIIDPAVYFGNREMDLGMMLLFGGFSDVVFSSYNERFPLAPGWKERIPLTQLYPLLVHVNLFGFSYVHQVKRIIDNFR